MSNTRTPTTSPQLKTISPSAFSSATTTTTTGTVTGTAPTVSAATGAAVPLPPAAVVVAAKRLWASPAAFVVVFVGAFLGAFGVGALSQWPSHDPVRLLAEGRAADVILVVDNASSPSPKWLLVKGKAHQRLGQPEPMLAAWQKAADGGVVDDEMRKHVFAALGESANTTAAAAVLAAWPDDDAFDAALAQLANDDVAARRHGAVAVLAGRTGIEPAVVAEARVKMAVVDVRSSTCEDKRAGLQSLSTLASDAAAAPFLKKQRAYDAVFSIDNDATPLQYPCLDAATIKRAAKSLIGVSN